MSFSWVRQDWRDSRVFKSKEIAHLGWRAWGDGLHVKTAVCFVRNKRKAGMGLSG